MSEFITAHLSAHHAWQGPRSEAPAWALRQIEGAPGAAINGEAATRAAGGQVGGSRHIATRASILAAAHDCVARDRAATHGHPERNFGRIAAYWSAHLEHPVSAADVPAMLAMLKLARIAANPGHLDSWVDLAGYAACGGEIAGGAQ